MNVPPTDAVRVPVEDLRTLVDRLFRKAGVPESDAKLITDLLIDTDLRGVLSHGTRTAPGYIRAFLEGSLNTTPEVRVVKDDVTTAVVDGDGGLGHPATYRAAKLAIEKAKASGVGAVVSRNHGHFGSAGKYTRMAIRQDCMGFCVSGHLIEEGRMTGDTPQWNPLGNPPMSIGFPSGTETPFILDMGTSFFEPDDFTALFDRIPAAFFKSLGLVGAALVMGGVMAGMMSREFLPKNRPYKAAAYGAFMMAVDIGRFVPVDEFKMEMDRSMSTIHTFPPLPGYERYEFPGGPEHHRERAWATNGIPLGEEHRKGLEKTAEEMGIAVPWKVSDQ